MRHIQAKDVASMPPDRPELCRPGEEIAQSRLLLHVQHALSSLPFPNKALNRWFCQSPDITAVEAMLRALKVATESYLESPVAVADLAAPFPLSQSGRQLLHSASNVAGLESAQGFQIAGQAAARANGIGAHHCYYEKDHCDDGGTPQLILTVDYSRAALTAILWIEEAGVFESRRIWHDGNLGADVLDRCHQGDEPCDERLVEALRQILKMPLEDTESDVPNVVKGLVLLGERAVDGRLKRSLQQVLGEQVISITVKCLKLKESGMIDPVFAAARGVATASWQAQDERFA